jgi:hypothetical protein
MDTVITPYQMCINNTARHINGHALFPHDTVDAFSASTVLAVAFCKSKEDVVSDLIVASGLLSEGVE